MAGGALRRSPLYAGVTLTQWVAQRASRTVLVPILWAKGVRSAGDISARADSKRAYLPCK